MTGDTTTTEATNLAVSARCVVVVRPGQLEIQQSTMYTPPWPLDVAQLQLLSAIDATAPTDVIGIKAAIIERSGVTEAHLDDVFFRLRVANFVMIGPKPDHTPTEPAPVTPSTEPFEPTTTVRLLTPVTLRLSDGRFELLDHLGRRLDALTVEEAAALAHLSIGSTVGDTFEAHQRTEGSVALPHDEFLGLLARLEATGLLVRGPVVAETHAVPPVIEHEAATLASVVTEIFDRHAAEQTAAEREREATTGVKRVKVIPVAFDVGAPAALGMVMAYARSFEDGRLQERYDFRTDWVWSDDRLEEFTAEPAIYLFSNYLWSHERCLEVSAKVKALSPGSITIHGGPDTPKYDNDMRVHFAENPHVDITVRGEGEATAAHLLDVLQDVIGPDDPDLSVLSQVPGISYRTPDGVQSTEDRDRIATLDILPSPYLEGMFDVFAGVPGIFVTFETNRGCPYGCTFCDWGSATTSRIRKFDIDRVYAEIDWCTQVGVSIIAVADANFGIFARDVDIAQRIADRSTGDGYPESVTVAYAKNTGKYVRPIISIMAEAGIMTQGVLSLQTMDPDALEVIRRSNIKTAQYDRLANEMRIARLPLVVELMMGLPGQSLTSFAEDLQQCVDRGVPARINLTTLLVNSPMNDPEYMAEHQIETERPLKPGVQAVLVSTATFSRDDYVEMLRLRSDFMLYENWSVLRHVAPFVRSETGMKEIDFYRLLRSRTTEQPQTWPALAGMVATGAQLMAPVHSWGTILGDLKRFLITELGIEDGPALESVIRAQHALLPSYGRTFPEVIELDHDVAHWAEQIMAAKATGHLHDWETVVPRLGTLAAGVLVVEDPQDIVGTSIGTPIERTGLGFNWEFDSPLSRASVSSSQFVDWVADSMMSGKNESTTDKVAVPVKLSRANAT